MIKEIKMPDLGTNADEMRIVRWLKQVGDAVKRGDMLFEVETDKSVMEVESYAAGILKKIIVQDDESVAVGGTIALIGEENDEVE